MARNIFNTVKIPRVKSSNFDLSYDHKLSCNMGELIPTHLQECVPGDRFHQNCETMIRFAPLLAPIMHQVDVYQHFFFVPNRLSWSNWEDFITGNQGDEPGPAHPYLSFNAGRLKLGTLADYFGIGTDFSSIDNVWLNALPFAAYNRVFNEFYRDQNLVPEVVCDLVDGGNTWNDEWNSVKRRSWMHDYFTAALPYAQKGDAVNIPIANDAQVYRTGIDSSAGRTWTNDNGGTTSVPGKDPGADFPDGTLIAGLEDATNTSIRDLRRAFRLQEWLEKNARAGSRYVESLLAHFGVRSSDQRIDRPEYLGGAKQPVVISEVLQTSETGSTPLAEMAGHGVSVGSGKAFDYRVEEHGYIIGIMSIMPKTAYMQGVPRTFLRNDKLDYYWPTFQNIGEQEVYSKEIYINQDAVGRDTVFGYVPRYSEYKYNPSRVSGDFRTTLDYWHLGRRFANPPLLNKDFVECNPTRDIFAVTDPSVHTIWAHVFHNIKAQRRMQKYGNPNL